MGDYGGVFVPTSVSSVQLPSTPIPGQRVGVRRVQETHVRHGHDVYSLATPAVSCVTSDAGQEVFTPQAGRGAPERSAVVQVSEAGSLLEENHRLRAYLQETEETVRDVRRTVRLQQQQQQQQQQQLQQQQIAHPRHVEARVADYESRLSRLQSASTALAAASAPPSPQRSPATEPEVIVRYTPFFSCPHERHIQLSPPLLHELKSHHCKPFLLYAPTLLRLLKAAITPSAQLHTPSIKPHHQPYRLRERCAKLNAECTRLASGGSVLEGQLDDALRERVRERSTAEARIAELEAEVARLQADADATAAIRREVESERQRQADTNTAHNDATAALLTQISTLEHTHRTASLEHTQTVDTLKAELCEVANALSVSHRISAQRSTHADDEAHRAATLHQTLTDRLTSTQRELEAAREELRGRSSDAEAELELVSSMNNELASRLEDAEGQLAGKREEVAALSSALAGGGNKAAKEIAALHESLREVEMLNAGLAERLEHADAGTAERTALRKEMHDTAQRDASARADAELVAAQLGARLRASEEQRLQLTMDNATMANNLAALGDAAHTDELTTLEAQVAEMQERLAATTAKEHSLATERDTLHTHVGDLQEANAELEAMNDELLTKLEAITADRVPEPASPTAPSPGNETTVLDEMNRELSARLEQMEATHASEIAIFSTKLQDLQSVNRSLTQELDSITKYEEQLHQLREHADRTESNNEDLMRKLQTLQTERDQADAETLSTGKALEEAANATLKHDKLTTSLKAKLAQLGIENLELVNTVRVLEADCPPPGTVENLRTENERLLTQSTQAGKDNEVILDELQRLEQHTEELEEGLAAAEERASTAIAAHQKDAETLQSLRHEVNTLSDQLALKKATAGEVESLLQTNDTLSTNLQQLGADNKELLETIESVRSAEQNAQQNINRLEAECKQLFETTEADVLEHRRLERLITELQSELQRKKDVATEEITEQDAAEATNSALTEHIAELKEENTRLRASQHDNTAEVELAIQVANLTERLADAETQHNTAQSSITSLEDQHLNNTTLIDTLRENAAHSDALRTKNDALQAQILQLAQDNEELLDAMDAAKKDDDPSMISSLEKSNAILKDRAEAAEGRAERLETEAKRKPATPPILPSPDLEAHFKNTELLTQIRLLERENVALKESMQRASTSSEEDLIMLREERKELEERLDRAESRVEELEDNHKQLSFATTDQVSMKRLHSAARTSLFVDHDDLPGRATPHTALHDTIASNTSLQSTTSVTSSQLFLCSPQELFAKDVEVRKSANYCRTLLLDMQELHTVVHGQPAAGQNKVLDMIASWIPDALQDVPEGVGVDDVPACYGTLNDEELVDALTLSSDHLHRLAELSQQISAQMQGLHQLQMH